MLLFCDIETTGLVPEDDLILEVGFVITDDSLHIKDEVSMVVHMDNIEVVPDEKGNPYYEPPFGIVDKVVKMHNESGLWRDCRSAPKSFTIRALENFMIQWVKNYGAEGLPLVGNTIGFDRNFLRLQTPRLHDLFHYRSLDISSIKIASNLWNPLDETEKPRNDKLHRSLLDCHDSIRELDAYKRIIFEFDRSFERDTSSR